MSDVYDSMIQEKMNANTTPPNKYDGIVQSAQKQAASSVQSSVYLAQPADPDRQAKILKLANKSGLPADLVERNFDRVNQEVEVAGNNYDDMIRRNPKVSAWLSDPNNAKIAKDNIQNLKAMEDTVNDTSFAGELFNAFAYGATNLLSSIAKSPALIADPTAGLPVGLADDYTVAEQVKANAPEIPRSLYENDFTRYLDQAAKGFAPKDIDANIIGEALEGNFKKSIRAMTFQIASNLPQLGVIAATRGAGLGILALSSSSSKMAENLEAGVPVDVARSNAAITGGIEAGIESLGGVGGKSFKSSIQTLVKGLGPDTAKDILVGSVKNIFKNSMGEGAEEFATSVAQDVLDYGMGVNDEGLDGIWQRAGNAFIVGAGSGGVTTAATITPRAAMEAFRTNAKTQQDVEIYQNMGQIVAESKLTERMPEKQKEVLKETVQGTPIQDVYMDLDGFETYFQSKGMTPAQAATELGLLDQYNQAKEAGTDIKINYADWTAATVTTEHYAGLQNDIKFSADGATQNQLKAESDQARAALQEASDETTGAKKSKPIAINKIDLTGVDTDEAMTEIFQTRQRAEQYLKRSTKELEAQAQNLSPEEFAYRTAQNKKVEALIPKMEDKPTESEVRGRRRKALSEVRSNITQQLVTAGLTSREAQIQSLVLSEGVGALADAAGMTPDQLAAEFPLQIQEGTEVMEGEGVLNQNDPRMVKAREQGFDTEQVFYHGTNENFESFDNEKIKRSYWGKGTYLSVDEGEAGTYGRKILRTYIRSKNQFNVLRDEPPKTVINWMKSNFPKEHRDIVKAVGADGMAYNYLDAAKDVIPPDTLTALFKDAGYDSLRMGDIVNVFDPVNIKSTDAIFAESSSGNIFSQDANDPRGQIQFKRGDKNFQAIISLFGAKDQSTFAHESAHYLFNVMGDLAKREGASQRLKDDYAGLLQFAGVESQGELNEQAQEKIARAWEAYLMEGKAPTTTLRRAFANFKTWLTAIYKTVQGLENAAGFQIQLTDEVRSIFDRMLMSQEQVELAELKQNYNPIFALAGLNDETAQRYVNALADARIAADDAIRTQLMETEVRKQEKFYKEQRKDIEAAVTAQANQMPVYVAHSIITKGVMPDGSPLPDGTTQMKVSRQSVVEKFGEDTAKRFPRGMFSTDADAASVDVVAEEYGFANSTEFVDQFSDFISKPEFIQATTNVEMESRYPDMMASPVISERAVREVHNQERDKVYRMEMDFLEKNSKGVARDALRRITRNVSDKVMKEQALKIIGGQTISEIKPILYARAEAKHNRLSGELYIKGDILGSLEAKRKAALNNYLYKAATEALDSVETDVKKFRKLFKKDSDLAKSRDVDLVNAARAVLAQFGITRKEKTPDEYLQPIAKYDNDTYQNLKVLVDQATAGAQNYEKISYDQFYDMANAVNALWDLSKERREIEIKGKKITREEMIKSLEDTIGETAKPANRKKYEGSMTNYETFMGWIAGFRASARIVEHWAIAMGGQFKDYIFDPIQESATAYRAEKNVKMKEYLATFKMLDAKSLNGGEIKAPELGDKVVFKNKSEVLGAILHTGNESNLRKLLLGRGYGYLNDDGSLDSGRWDQFKNRMIKEGVLTKADFDWAQAVWDLNETLKPGAWKAHKKMYGFYPNEITANEFTVVFDQSVSGLTGATPVTYRGGYVPAVADPTRSNKAQTREEQNSMEMNAQNSFMFPTTGRGFTKGRVDSYNAPLSLNINQVAGHIDKVLRFTHIEPNVKFINSIVTNESFMDKMATVDVAAVNSMLTPWLQRAASQRMSSPLGTDQGWKGIDKVASILRTRVGMQIMGGNVINALQNYTGLSVSLVLVKPKFLRNSLWDYSRNSTLMVDTIAAKSQFMANQLKDDTRDIQQEIDRIIEEPTASQKVGDWVNKNAYILQRISQDQVSAITWLAAYNQSIESGMDDVAAVAEADSIVRQTQANMTPEGSSRIMAGPPVLQLFVQFFGYFNNLANLNETQFKKIVKESGLRQGAGKLFLLMFLGTWMPAVLSDVVRRAASGVGFDEDDDDEYMDDFIQMFLGAPVSFATAQVPFAGQISNLVVNRFNDKRYDDRLNLSPTISMIESMAQLPGDVYDAIDKKSQERKGIRNVMNVLGVMTNLPGGAVARPLTYLNDIRNGKADPEGPVDFTRGFITGKPGNN